MGAGRALAETRRGWRIVLLVEIEEQTHGVWLGRLDAIRAKIDENAQASWSLANGDSNTQLFLVGDEGPTLGRRWRKP